MKLISGPSSPLISKRISEISGFGLAKTTYRKFPDGELYFRLEDQSEERYAVINSLNSSDDLVFLLLALDALSDKDVVAVVPYMGYARQDKAFLEGEAVSIRAVARMLESYASKVITVNIHSEDAKRHFRKLVEIDAMKVIGEHYKGKDIIMLSPDKGSFERVKRAAKIAGCDFDYLEKRRIDAENVEIFPKNLEVENKNIVLVDDIISTGGTIITAASHLYERANNIETACIHAVLAGNALNRLYSSGISRVVATDTVERQVSILTVSRLIGEVLLSEV